MDNITEQAPRYSKEQLTKFNSVIKSLAKSVEVPNAIRYGLPSMQYKKGWAWDGADGVEAGYYTLDNIKEVKAKRNIEGMRRISNYFYQTSSSYRRILNYFSYLYKYYYMLDLKGLESAVKKKKGPENLRKLYNDCLNFLDGFNIEDTFGFIASRMLVDGGFYGYTNYMSDGRTVITMLQPKYCRTYYKSSFNTEILEFDIRYFNTIQNETLRKDTLKSFPKEVQKRYKEYENNKLNTAKPFDSWWVAFPPETSCVFTFGGIPIPPFYDSIIDILNYDDYKEIEKARNTQELEKILVQSFELDDDGDLEVLNEEMEAMHEAAVAMLGGHEMIDILTTIANVDLKDVQSAATVANDNLTKALAAKYEGAGTSFELFASTTATSLELSISNSTSFMSQAINKFSDWLTMVTYARNTFKDGVEPLVTILPLTWYNEKRMNDLYLKSAQAGYDLILPYIATGKKQSTLVDAKILQNDILGLPELLIPPQTSFTMTGETGTSTARQKGDVQTDTKPRGRPEKDPEDRSEKTNRNREAK